MKDKQLFSFLISASVGTFFYYLMFSLDKNLEHNFENGVTIGICSVISFVFLIKALIEFCKGNIFSKPKYKYEFMEMENEKLKSILSLDTKRFLEGNKDSHRKIEYLKNCMINYRHRSKE